MLEWMPLAAALQDVYYRQNVDMQGSLVRTSEDPGHKQNRSQQIC